MYVDIYICKKKEKIKSNEEALPLYQKRASLADFSQQNIAKGRVETRTKPKATQAVRNLLVTANDGQMAVINPVLILAGEPLVGTVIATSAILYLHVCYDNHLETGNYSHDFSDITNLRDMKFKFSAQVRAIIDPCMSHSHECILYISQGTETHNLLFTHKEREGKKDD